MFPAPRRLLVVGDSVADTMRRSFSHQVPPGMAVKDIGKVGCSPAGPDRPQVRFYTGAEALDPCADAVTEWPALVADGHYDGVLMVFGGSGLDRQFGDQWLRPCDAEYNAWFQAAMETNLRALQAQGARIWVALAPYNRHASVAAPDAQAAADRQTDCLNDMYAGAARAVGGVAVIDLARAHLRHPLDLHDADRRHRAASGRPPLRRRGRGHHRPLAHGAARAAARLTERVPPAPCRTTGDSACETQWSCVAVRCSPPWPWPPP